MSTTLLHLGRLRLPTVSSDFKEGVSEPLDTTGSGVALGQRRPKLFGFELPLLAIPGTQLSEDLVAAGFRFRRQLRSTLQNPVLRGHGFYLLNVIDPEVNGWVMVGNGQIAYADGNVVFGNFTLTLDEIYKVAALSTHRPALRVQVTDRRLLGTPRDFRQQVFSTDFAGLAIKPLVPLPPGVTDISSDGGPMATALMMSADGFVPVGVNPPDGALLSFEQAEALRNQGQVVVYDRQGQERQMPSQFTVNGTVQTLMVGIGHSYVAGVNVQVLQDFLSLTGRHYSAAPLNQGVGGSTLQALLSAVFAGGQIAYPQQTTVIMWGMNDLAAYGVQLGGFKAGLRALISRQRTFTADLHAFNDASITYTGTWTTGTAEKDTTVNGSTATIATGSGFVGGTIAVQSNISQSQGAVYTFTVDGVLAGTWDTRTLCPTGGAPAVTGQPAVLRLKGLSPGAHSIVVTVSSVATSANIAGWWVEQSQAALVVVVKQPLPYSYGNYSASFYVPTDADIGTLNAAIDSVIGEFDAMVRPVLPDLKKDPALFTFDGLHPNPSGHLVIAYAIQNAIEATPNTTLTSWEEAYDSSYPFQCNRETMAAANGTYAAQIDTPVLANGHCQVRFDQLTTANGQTPGWIIDQWTGTTWAEQGKVVFNRYDGTTTSTLNLLLSSNIVEYTYERTVLHAVMASTGDPAAREHIYITLQRGWTGPRFESYPAPRPDGTAAGHHFVWVVNGVDANDSLSIDQALVGQSVSTAGTGSQQFASLAGNWAFNGENWAQLLREQSSGFDVTFGVLQTLLGIYGAPATVGYPVGVRNNLVVIYDLNANLGYLSVHLAFSAHSVNQIFEAEAGFLGATSAVVTDSLASGGHTVSDTQTTFAAITTAVATTLPLAKYRARVRVKVDSGATGSFIVQLGTASSAIATSTATVLTWIDLGDILAPSASPTLAASGWRSAGGSGKVYIDRVELAKVEDTSPTAGTALGARDFGQSILVDTRAVPVPVER